MARHVKRGDQVMVTSGNNKGQVGEILSIDIEGDRVVVSGINVRKRNLKPTQQRPQGGGLSSQCSFVAPTRTEMSSWRASSLCGSRASRTARLRRA